MWTQLNLRFLLFIYLTKYVLPSGILSYGLCQPVYHCFYSNTSLFAVNYYTKHIISYNNFFPLQVVSVWINNGIM